MSNSHIIDSIFLSSNNAHKIKELQQLFHQTQLVNIKIYSLSELNIELEVEESGKTFLENAYLKAEGLYDYINRDNTVYGKFGNWAILADDSGLEVDALDGGPGVYSARWSQLHGGGKNNIELILEQLKGIPFEQRTARFVCVLVLINNKNFTQFFMGKLEGHITLESKGTEGFGYDPIFIPKGYNKTIAELGTHIKQTISHRYLACKQLADTKSHF